jgi:transcription antitermination factor NusG
MRRPASRQRRHADYPGSLQRDASPETRFCDPRARSVSGTRESAPLVPAEPAHAAPLDPVHPGYGWRWFALCVRSRFEFSVRDALREAGFGAFLPTWAETVRWSDRERVTTRPLFAGYVFAHFDATRDAPDVRQTRGVVQILSIDQQPVAIPDEVIENLQRIAASPAAVTRCPYVAGATVTVARGPFAGVTGVVSRVKGATLLSIPVAILGRSVSVEIEAADVEKADS